jgi:hypothetical protein
MWVLHRTPLDHTKPKDAAEITRITNIAKQALKDNGITDFDFDTRMHKSVQNEQCTYADYPELKGEAKEEIVVV